MPNSDKPEQLDLRSDDVSLQKRAELKSLFPSVFTESRNDDGELVESIDFEKLKAELGTFSDVFESRRERYGMDWPGKKDCIKLIQQPSIATLKPDRESSVDFDETENLFIEGDNLEVLKLMQKSYYGSVKLIYIDPPYNTGEEFIYPDNYSESLDTYLAYAGLVDLDGRSFSTNTENEGRFHTKWLNMMYPRLYLARNLMREDGVICISIGDNEVSNLRKLCDEVFGEDNFISTISRLMKSGGAKGRFFTPNIDYILVYAKEKTKTEPFRTAITKDQIDSYYNKIETDGPRKGEMYGEERVFKASLDPRANQRYWIECPDGEFVIPPGKNFPKTIANGEKITPTSEDKVWKWTFERYSEEYEVGNIIFKETSTSGLVNSQGKQTKWNIYNKLWLKEQQDKGKVPSNYIGDYENRQSSAELQELDIPFDYAKPTKLIRHLLEIVRTNEDDIILDFFTGSSTTAHATLGLNNEDGQRRRFIMVQLPEPCDEKSEAFKAGYKNISDISKERIRRVIERCNAEEKGKLDLGGKGSQDRGFKVFTLDSSNFDIWDGTDPNASSEELSKQLSLYVDHIDPDASQEDILYELLLKSGFMPTEKVEKLALAEKTVYSVSDGALLICLEDEITRDLVDAVAEAEPLRFICLDKAFQGNDQLKANAVQTFDARNQGRDKADQIVFRTV